MEINIGEAHFNIFIDRIFMLVAHVEWLET